MLDFVDGDYGVLIATTIIESGLDIPNVNTIIINNAQNFGLSTLHQLRGRVGRTNKKAFAYFLAPPVTALSNDAKRRLKAIEEFSELGAGFNLSLQDLDIRGAGNLLGGEQSRFIADIGFETYTKILNEAIQELKEKEYKELFTNNDSDKDFDNIEYVTDCSVDTDLELSLPIEYVTNISERIKLYRDLDNITEEEKIVEFENNLIDRFGKLPNQSKELLNVVRLRQIAESIGIEKVIVKNSKMLCYFISNQESTYFQSDIFGNILNKVQQYQNIVSMKEKNNKLMLTFNETKSIAQANDLLKRFVVS
jgi:transcription-repair coupling factor (superfamily II helicase)